MTQSFTSCRIEKAIEEAWREKQNSPCIWWQGEWWTYNMLIELANKCEIKLRGAGFGEGQRIALLLPNSPFVLAIAIACWRLGGAIAPLNARAGAVNLVETIKMLDVNAVILTEEGLKKAREFPCSIPIIPVNKDYELPDWKGRESIHEDASHAVIFSTSGTSGLPKAVICTHKNILSNVFSIPKHLPDFLSDRCNVLNVLPNFHTFGMNVAGIMPLVFGIQQTIVQNFVPVDNTIKAIEAAHVNKIIAVPTVIAFLLSALDKKNHYIKGIEHIVSGGDRLNTAMEERAKKYLGIGILEGYGLTECSPILAVNRTNNSKKLGTVGLPFEQYQLEIHDREGNLIDIHDEGVLWVKGDSVVPGYFRDEKNTNERFSNGWFNTGDVVRIDEEGFIHIIDRATDIIIVSGFNVYPKEVEAVLTSHDAVKSAVCVGEKNNVAGELVKAFIILNEGKSVTSKELMDYCKERLAHYKVPRKIGFVTEYPVSPSGKILRRELRTKKIEK